MRGLVLFVLLGGCAKVFNLEHVGTDAAIIPAEHDASVDAAPVNCPIAVVYDEDGDNIDDRCDACPTMPGDNTLDQDEDGLPNACDLNLATTDMILFAATFAEQSDLTAFESSGVAWKASGKGTISFPAETKLRTTLPYMPRAIEVRTTGASTTSVTGVLGVGTINVMCDVSTSTCDGSNNTQTCVRLTSAVGQGLLPTNAAELRKVSLLRTKTPETLCVITNSTSGQVQVTADVPIGLEQIQITTNGSATAVVESIVIYGGTD